MSILVRSNQNTISNYHYLHLHLVNCNQTSIAAVIWTWNHVSFFFLVNKWKRHRHAPLCMHAMLRTQAREFPIMCVKLGTRISTLVGVTPMTIARP